MHTYAFSAMSKTSSPDRVSLIRVGVAGATGYAGQELVRLIAGHPAARLSVAMSSTRSEEVRRLPGLAKLWDGEVVPLDVERLASESEVVFLALPEKAVPSVAAPVLAAGRRIIDLSGAFRLRNAEDRLRWYPETTELPPSIAYGLTERNRRAIAAARVVACPGCYPTAALLALGPLIDAGLIQGEVIVDAKSGISGAGRAPTDRTHFSENFGSAAAYAVFSHRHAAEMEQELERPVTFVPHLVPLNRGILETIYARVTPGARASQINDAFKRAYGDAPFIRLWSDGLPEIKHVAHTNFCDIGWRLDETSGRLVLVACLDNLLKGAASQAIQNFNLMCGVDERTGLQP
jgi:N-acetyl-gamma-glutamyl-phosphate reductase